MIELNIIISNRAFVPFCNCRISRGYHGETYRKVLEEICGICLDISNGLIEAPTIRTFQELAFNLLLAADTQGAVFKLQSSDIFDVISCIHSSAVIAGIEQNLADDADCKLFLTYPALTAAMVYVSESMSEEWMTNTLRKYFKGDSANNSYMEFRFECTEVENNSNDKLQSDSVKKSNIW